MKISATTIEEFFEGSGQYKESIMRVDEFIRKHAPELERKLYPGETICVLGYGEIPYKDSVLPIVSVAPQKNNISLYVMAWKDGQSLVDRYAGTLGKTSNGKACIRFKTFSDLNQESLIRLVAEVTEIFKAKNERR